MPNEQTAEVLKDGPIQDNAEDTATATAQRAGEAEPQATETDHDDADHSGKRKGGWLRKLERAQLEAEFWREKALGTATPENEQKTSEDDSKPPVKPIRPKQSDFKTWEEYETAREKYEDERDEYHAKLTKYEVAQARKEVAQQTEQQTVADGWATRVAEAEADPEMPDFRKVAFNEDVPLSQAMLHAIVKSEMGTQVAYYLGKHPDEAETIAQMDAAEAFRAIGRIESRIEASKPAAEKTDDTQTAPTTRAPRPPSTVRKTSSASSEPSDDDDYKTWLKKREAQLKAR